MLTKGEADQQTRWEAGAWLAEWTSLYTQDSCVLVLPTSWVLGGEVLLFLTFSCGGTHTELSPTFLKSLQERRARGQPVKNRPATPGAASLCSFGLRHLHRRCSLSGIRFYWCCADSRLNAQLPGPRNVERFYTGS